MLDIFALRNQIIDDYHRYIDSFLNIRDRKVKAFVDGEFDKFIKKVTNSPIRVEQYTGQESLERKTEIQNNPPRKRPRDKENWRVKENKI